MTTKPDDAKPYAYRSEDITMDDIASRKPDDAKPSLAERIEVLAACDENVPLDADLRAIAAELREIAAGMHDHRARWLPETTIIDKWADRLARKEET